MKFRPECVKCEYMVKGEKGAAACAVPKCIEQLQAELTETTTKYGKEVEYNIKLQARIKTLEEVIVKKDKALTYALRFLDPKECHREFVNKALKGKQ